MAIKDWTLQSIPDLSSKYFLVTGANSGIGYFTALELARKGASVLMACRSQDKANEALELMKKEINTDKVQIGLLDLSSMESVKKFAADFESKFKFPKLDVLINSAGRIASDREITVDGFEAQFGTNHLGHYVLTALLMSTLLKSESPRVINVSSIAHQRAKINFDDLKAEKSYDAWAAYSQSKLANICFTRGLYQLSRQSENGKKLICLAVHPGVSKTNFNANMKPGIQTSIFNFISSLFNSPLAAAFPSLYAATADDVEQLGYYGPSGMGEYAGKGVKKAKLSKAAQDDEIAKRLMEESQKLTEVKFDF